MDFNDSKTSEVCIGSGVAVLASWFLCRVSKKMAAKKAAQRVAASGILARPNWDGGAGDSLPFPQELNARVTYPSLFGGAMEEQWKGLARGGSAAGVAYVAGRPTLRANFGGENSTTSIMWLHSLGISTMTAHHPCF